MASIYLNPQYNGPAPTRNDDVTTSWGSMTYDTLTANSLHVAGGTTVTVTDLSVTNLTVDNNGTLTVQSITDIDTLHVGGGAHVTIAAGVTIKNLILDNDAHVTLAGGVTVTDTFSIEGGSHLDVKGFMSILGTQITVYGDISYVWGVDVKSGSHITHDRGSEPCYLEGAMIRMADGSEKAVEDLEIDDVVSTLRGPEKVTFVGKHHHVIPKDTKALFLEEDELGRPVVIRKHTFGLYPTKDLRVTPEHMIVLAGRLVPVRLMVNDVDIYYDTSVDDYDYYHFTVEGGHAIVTANGIASETFFVGNQDTADRWLKTTATSRYTETDVLAAPLMTDMDWIAKGMTFAGVANTGRLPRGERRKAAISLSGQGETIFPIATVKADTYRFLVPAYLSGQRMILNTESVRVDTVLACDDRRHVGFRGRVRFLLKNGDVVTVETTQAADQWRGWYPDGWSTQFPEIIIPEGCAQIVVEMDAYLPNQVGVPKEAAA